MNMINKAKENYYKDQISLCSNHKELFKIVERLLHQKGDAKLPSSTSESELATRFNDYFISKISIIRQNLDACAPTVSRPSSMNMNLQTSSSLECFSLASEEEIFKLISSSPSKSCSLDPIPTWMLKEHISTLLPVITNIVNCSLQTATFPDDFKNAQVIPLLKKPSLDPEILKNFRPVSNLKFVSKIVEKVVAHRLAEYISSNNLCEQFQSAYRRNHGTETALLRVQNDILRELDKKHGVFLVLLDLSAAFDTIDHDVLFTRLESIGVKGLALGWLKSYLCNRSQAVNINGTLSSKSPLYFGVPQGSVLGPILFNIYSSPIAKIARNHGLFVHAYADDTQLYIPFELNDPSDKLSALKKTEACIIDIKAWMTQNKLKLNDDKTEFLVMTSKFHQQKVSEHTAIQVDSASIAASSYARNLGVMFDSSLSMEKQVNKICQSVFYHIRNVNSIRKTLSDDSAATIIHALITSRLDNGNALLYDINENLLTKLQLAQNAAARILTKTRKYDHITPVLKELHWLPVRWRIIFKLLLLTWKCVNDKAPSYLQEFIVPYSPARQLRSANKFLLTVPRTISSYGDRSFSACAPKLWNSLPMDIRETTSLEQFKKLLKTYLFNCAYNSS